jgi:NhaA family Na+:H+ antiporter
VTPAQKARRAVLRALPTRESQFIAASLREETVGGALLLIAALVAVAWASSPFGDSYGDLRGTVIGPAALHLDLTLQEWAGDGLLAIFFFVAGLELKRELVVGQLRQFSEAVLPVAAALCGMVVPALVYLAVAWQDPEALRGWAVPMATDIAFALAVLAVIGSSLPTTLRAFLLTLAVVDDLGAILVIAIAYTSSIKLGSLAAAAVGLGFYGWLQHRRVHTGWLLIPLALVVWALVHDSGIHATIAGVALGLLTRVRPDADEEQSPAERLEHRVRPLSAGFAVPVFALLSAGVPFRPDSLTDALRDTAAVAVIAGLVVGKFLGVLGGTWLTARLTRAELSPDLGWLDVAAVALLAGIGFTVSLLIGDLAFADADRASHVKTGVLLGSLACALLASGLLLVRQRHYRRRVADAERVRTRGGGAH